MTGRKLILHWSGGALTPNATDFEHYHYLVDGKGNVYHGDHSIQANDNTADDDYAMHCGGGNTKRIGISACGMLGFASPTNNIKKHLLTKVQMEAVYLLSARLLFNEGYRETNDDIQMTHKEFGIKNPSTSSAGKIDICSIPSEPSIAPEQVGNFIRNKTTYYLNKIIKGELSSVVKVVN